RRLEQTPQLVAVTTQANALLGNEGGRILAPGLALLARKHLLRPKQLNRLPVDGVGERDGPEDVLALLLAARAQVGGQSVEGLAVFGKMHLEHRVASRDLATIHSEAGLEGLRVEERV